MQLEWKISKGHPSAEQLIKVLWADKFQVTITGAIHVSLGPDDFNWECSEIHENLIGSLG